MGSEGGSLGSESGSLRTERGSLGSERWSLRSVSGSLESKRRNWWSDGGSLGWLGSEGRVWGQKRAFEVRQMKVN